MATMTIPKVYLRDFMWLSIVLSVGLLWLIQSWTLKTERQARLKAEVAASAIQLHFEALGFVFIQHDGYREIRYQPKSDEIQLYRYPPANDGKP